MQTFQLTPADLKLTENFEGLRLTAYQDVAGVWTIGYGHTGPEVHKGLVWTLAQAQDALQRDLAKAVQAVNSLVTSTITHNQFDAMVDFTFNAGTHAFAGSTLLRLVNAGEYTRAAAEFLKWVNAGGRRVEGLARRRAAEQAMFLAT